MKWLWVKPFRKINDVGPLKNDGATGKAISFVQIFPILLPHVSSLALNKLIERLT